jgi:hypothetical protein
MAYNYTNPGWINNNLPALNATNLNAMSNLLAGIGAAYDAGGNAPIIAGSTRNIITTSGNLGVLTVINDTDYYLTGTTTVTLPSAPIAGQRILFCNKVTASTTILGNSNQGIGLVYGSSSFTLYFNGDYVNLEWDGIDGWMIISTNGPVITSYQTAQVLTTTQGSWTAIGSGLSLGALPIGIYDIDMNICFQQMNTILPSAFCIGINTTPINRPSTVAGAASTEFSIYSSTKGYVLATSSIIQGLYLTDDYQGRIQWRPYSGVYSCGVISARRIG